MSGERGDAVVLMPPDDAFDRVYEDLIVPALRDAGFAVERERLVHLERTPGPARRALPRITNVADRVLVRLRPGLFAQQFVLRLRPLAAQ